MTTTPLMQRSAEQFAEKMIESVSATFDVFSMYLGDRLGFYQVLAQDGPLTPGQLASRTGTQERYVREWLEHQAVAGVLEVQNGAAPLRFSLPPEHAEVLANPDSLNYLAPMPQLAAAVVGPLEEIVRVYREGGGLCFHHYGRDAREGQGRMNRAVQLQLLGPEWIPTMPDVHRRLSESPDARVVDFGCGVGWSSIGIALTYPNVRVDGFDTDVASIQAARQNAAEFGVSDRVRFEVRDAADPELRGRYDFALAFECVHDMPDPVAALGTMRRLVHQDGAVMVVDERVADEFDPAAGTMEKLMYGFSILHCLPSAMAEPPAAGTGTVMRTATFRRYAGQAGFESVEVLPIDHPMLRFYRLLT